MTGVGIHRSPWRAAGLFAAARGFFGLCAVLVRPTLSRRGPMVSVGPRGIAALRDAAPRNAGSLRVAGPRPS